MAQKKRDSQPHADTYQSGRDNSPSRCDFHKIFWLYAVQLWTRCVEMPGHQDPRGPWTACGEVLQNTEHKSYGWPPDQLGQIRLRLRFGQNQQDMHGQGGAARILVKSNPGQKKRHLCRHQLANTLALFWHENKAKSKPTQWEGQNQLYMAIRPESMSSRWRKWKMEMLMEMEIEQQMRQMQTPHAGSPRG